MIFLQAVDVPEKCFLQEVLFWVAVQRLPEATSLDVSQKYTRATTLGSMTSTFSTTGRFLMRVASMAPTAGWPIKRGVIRWQDTRRMVIDAT
jgi:hypothetical protein